MRIIKKIIKYIIGCALKISFIPILGYFWGLNKQEDIFILCDRWNEARDNGFALFQYLRQKYPEKPVYYVFDTNDKNIDYQKLQPYRDNVIPYRGIKFFVYLYYARYIASSHTDIMVLCEDYLGNWDQKATYFLQHGITMNNLGNYYKESIAKFDIICAGSSIEFEFLQDISTGLKIKPLYTGFARWDRLHDVTTESTILVMPTWRRNLVLPIDGAIKNLKDRMEYLKTSKYFLKWQEFINGPKLHQMLSENHIKIKFYTHPSVSKIFGEPIFISNNSTVQIVDPQTEGLIELIEKSAMCITDYSSIFWEFAYTKRPVIYYQFDEEEFRSGHLKKGYFDYNKDSFGAVADNIDSVLKELESCIKREFIIENNYIKKIEQHFKLFDNKNCERIEELIYSHKITK